MLLLLGLCQVEAAVARWSGEGCLLFTSSTAVYEVSHSPHSPLQTPPLLPPPPPPPSPTPFPPASAGHAPPLCLAIHPRLPRGTQSNGQVVTEDTPVKELGASPAADRLLRSEQAVLKVRLMPPAAALTNERRVPSFESLDEPAAAAVVGLILSTGAPSYRPLPSRAQTRLSTAGAGRWQRAEADGNVPFAARASPLFRKEGAGAAPPSASPLPSRPSMTYPLCCIRLSTPPSPPERPPPPSNPLPCPPHAPTQCSRHRNFVNTFLHYEDAGTLCVAVSPRRT